MEILIALSSLLFLILLFLGIRLWQLTGKIHELNTKTEFSNSSDEIMKVSIEGNKQLCQVADNYNAVVEKYKTSHRQYAALKLESSNIKTLSKRIKDVEAVLSEANLLTEIGKRITGKLDVDEILETVHEFVKSSMDLLELDLLYKSENHLILISVGDDGKIQRFENTPDKDSSLLFWTYTQGKEVLLNEAENNYSQYLNHSVRTLGGLASKACIYLPLSLHGSMLGAIGITAQESNAYSKYHLDFMKTIASYLAVAIDNSNVYEQLAKSKRTVELEQEKSESLLLNILPESVATELKESGTFKAREYDQITVLFTDFKGFTNTSAQLSAPQLVAELNACFVAFDNIVDQYDLEKIKTIGDSYMAAIGFDGNKTDSTKRAVLASIEMQRFITNRRRERESEGLHFFEMRLGLNTGPLVAGIVGAKKFQYDIWGDTVNTASRMESAGEEGKVNISKSTYHLVKDEPEFAFEFRGQIEAKGKGAIEMWFVDENQ